jgi:hypothetical protein
MPLQIVLDPRAKYTIADRQAQFETVMKIYNTIEHMSYSVNAIEGVRNAAKADAAKLPEKDPLRAKLGQVAEKSDALRSRIVATKEGGMITGEERIREHLGQLYGDVNGYEGKPGDYQLARADSLAHELQDVIDDFNKMTSADLPAINTALKKKKMAEIVVLTEPEWQQQHQGSGGSKETTTVLREMD